MKFFSNKPQKYILYKIKKGLLTFLTNNLLYEYLTQTFAYKRVSIT